MSIMLLPTAKPSRSDAMLCTLEDNDAVIQMIIKGLKPDDGTRVPTMGHVSRAHRVALDGLFDRINLDPKIQIKYMDTKHQLADIPTKGNVSRDEWNNLLHLFNISNFSSASCCPHQTMSKRAQEGTGEERVTAKSKPMMNLVSKTVGKSSMSLSSSASNSHGTLNAQSQNLGLISQSAGRLAPKDSNEDAASSPQAWQSDVNPSSSAGRLAPTGKTQKVIDEDWPHNFAVSASVVGHLEKVYSNLRQNIGRQPGDEMLDLNVNWLICGMFMSATMEAAVHLGQNYQETLHSTSQHKKKENGNNYSTCHRNGLRIKKKSQGYLRFIGTHNHGKELLCWVTEQSNCRQHKYTSSPIRFFVLAKIINTQKP